jgi:ribosomal protein S18 acetylase RimI-like enzyme
MGKKTSKGKINKYFNTGTSLEVDIPNKKKKKPNSKSKASQMKAEETEGYSTLHKFRGKLKRLFLLKIPPPVTTEGKNSLNHDEIEPYVAKDYNYIQMKLDLRTISSTYEQDLEKFRLSDLKVRKAMDVDKEILVRLYNRAFMMGSDPWSPATCQQFEEILGRENTVTLIASKYGEDVGFIIVDLEEADFKTGTICGLGTDPRWRRKGIARFLGVAAWDYFRKNNVQELHCEVYDGNHPSYCLIKSLEFVEYGNKTYKF